MSTLSDFKAKNPAYKDVPDGQLADALYTKYYSNIPKDQYYAKIGYNPQESAQMDAARAQAKKYVSTFAGSTEALEGATADHGEQIAEAGIGFDTRMDNLVRGLMGKKIPYTAKQEQEAFREAYKEKRQDWESKHPVSSLPLNVAGGVAPIVAMEMGTGGMGTPAVAPRAAGLIGKIGQGAAGLAKAAGIGGVLGAASGQGRSQQQGASGAEQVEAAKEGGEQGAILGGLLHAGGMTLGPAASGLDRLTGFKLSGAARAAENEARKILGMAPNTKASPAQVAAANRLAGNVDQTKADAQIRAENAKRTSVGAPATKTYSSDIATQRMKGTMKTAASRLEDDSRLVKERESVEKDLGAKAKARTEKTIPSTIRPGEEAPHRASRLKRERQDEANLKYKPHYNKEVQPHQSVMAVLGSPVGEQALKSYRAEAEMLSHNMDAETAAIGQRAMQDIDSLGQYYEDVKARAEAQRLAAEHPDGIPDVQPSKDTMDLVEKLKAQGPRSQKMAQDILDAHGFKPVEVPPEPQAPKVTLRTLDEIRQFTNRAADRPQGGNESVQGAYRGLSDVMDQHLSDPLAEARKAYYEKSVAIEAAEMGGDLFNKTPAEVAHDLTARTADPAKAISDLPKEAQDSLRVNARDQILGAIKTPEKSAALLQRVAGDEKAQTMLKALFGDKEAQSYIDASKIMLEDARSIEQIAPTDKPIQTDDTADALKKGAHAVTWMHKAPEIIATWALKHGLTMSTEEARAVEELGLGKPEALLKMVRDNPDTPFSTMISTILGRIILTSQSQGQNTPVIDGQSAGSESSQDGQQ